MRAIVIGATGAVGRNLLSRLLSDDRFRSVDVFARRDVGVANAKLTVHLVDFANPDAWRHLVVGDVLFSCLGTTRAAAGSKEAQWRVDHDYQFEFAKAAEANGVNSCVLVSSVGASAGSSLFYARMKGVLDDEVSGMAFRHVAIMRPPSLIRQGSDRFGERVSVRILQALNAVGLFRKLAPMPTDVVARAMIAAATSSASGVEMFNGQEIRALADGTLCR